MKTNDLLAAIEKLKVRSAWNKGVKMYAYEIVDYVAYYVEEIEFSSAEKVLLNGAQNWMEYSEGGCALVYDWDIAQRLCAPYELKALTRKDGTLRYKPNNRETWIELQARALHQACYMVKDVIKFNEFDK